MDINSKIAHSLIRRDYQEMTREQHQEAAAMTRSIQELESYMRVNANNEEIAELSRLIRNAENAGISEEDTILVKANNRLAGLRADMGRMAANNPAKVTEKTAAAETAAAETAATKPASNWKWRPFSKKGGQRRKSKKSRKSRKLRKPKRGTKLRKRKKKTRRH